MEDINAFNNLGTLSQANQVLQARLAVLGDRKDLHELKYVPNDTPIGILLIIMLGTSSNAMR